MKERFMMSVPPEMYEAIQKEMWKRRLDTIQETVRQIISEHLRGKTQ